MVKMAISMCPEHGMYDKHNLCPCYDSGGPMAHLRSIYGTKAWFKRVENMPNKMEYAACPIHGETTVNNKGIFQCGCYDEDGNKIVHLTDNPNNKEMF